MKGRVIAVLVVAGVLGLAAIVLAFTGEATSIKADHVALSFSTACKWSPELAKGLGIVAAVLLLLHHILISVGARCFSDICCARASTAQARPSGCPSVCSLICFIFSWVVFVGAFRTLIIAALVNNVNINPYGNNPCPIPRPRLFAGAGVLCIVSVILSFVSYILFICTDRKTVAPQATENGVAMAQPRFPKEQV